LARSIKGRHDFGRVVSKGRVKIHGSVKTYNSRDRTGWFALRDSHYTSGWRRR
jgi:hypothetical protein